MQKQLNIFAKLAGEVRAGNTQVKAQIRQVLEPCLVRILSQALAPGAAPLPLQARLRAAARGLQEGGGPAPDNNRLASILCQRVVSRLAPTPTEMTRPLDTFAL